MTKPEDYKRVPIRIQVQVYTFISVSICSRHVPDMFRNFFKVVEFVSQLKRTPIQFHLLLVSSQSIQN